jgi:hypothetical protein
LARTSPAAAFAIAIAAANVFFALFTQLFAAPLSFAFIFHSASAFSSLLNLPRVTC